RVSAPMPTAGNGEPGPGSRGRYVLIMAADGRRAAAGAGGPAPAGPGHSGTGRDGPGRAGQILTASLIGGVAGAALAGHRGYRAAGLGAVTGAAVLAA